MSNMINPDMISQALKQSEATTPDAKPTTPSAPNEADKQKFESTLNAQPPQSVENVQPTQGQAPESVQAASNADVQTKVPGDNILDQMQKISHALSSDNKYVQDTLKNMGTESMNPEDMLKLQYHLAQMTTDTALTTSIASDLKKGVTTLMNNQ